MKVLYVLNDTLHHGGTESVVLNYHGHIDKEKVQIDYVLNTTKEELSTNSLISALLEKGINVYSITPRRQDAKSNREEYMQVLAKGNYDIVHAHADAANNYFLKLAKKAGVRVRISHSHNTRHQLKVNSLKSLIHYCYLENCRREVRKYATHYMACSIEAGRWLYGNKAVANKEVYILNNAIDIGKYKFDASKREAIRQQLNIADKTVIGHVGRFVEQKNHDFLIDTFAKMTLMNDKYVLLLVGDGTKRKSIEEKAKSIGINDRVIFYGDTDNVCDIYNAMDIFAFPSLHEGLSVVMIETQCNGLVSLVSDIGTVSKDTAITELVQFEPLNVQKWAKRLDDMPVGRIDCTDTIRQKGYDIELEAVKLVKFYEDICKRR